MRFSKFSTSIQKIVKKKKNYRKMMGKTDEIIDKFMATENSSDIIFIFNIYL